MVVVANQRGGGGWWWGGGGGGAVVCKRVSASPALLVRKTKNRERRLAPRDRGTHHARGDRKARTVVGGLGVLFWFVFFLRGGGRGGGRERLERDKAATAACIPRASAPRALRATHRAMVKNARKNKKLTRFRFM